MNKDQFNWITREIDQQLEGEGYFLNITLMNGHVRNNVAVKNCDDLGLVELQVTDQPPEWVDVTAIIAVELST